MGVLSGCSSAVALATSERSLGVIRPLRWLPNFSSALVLHAEYQLQSAKLRETEMWWHRSQLLHKCRHSAAACNQL